MKPLLDTAIFILGALLAVYTVKAAVRTFVLPRGDNVWLTRMVFQTINRFVEFRVRFLKDEAKREANRAMFAPMGLLALPIAWLTFVLIGFMGMFWAIGVRPWSAAFLLSGSSLLTLGFAPVENNFQTILAFIDATTGLILIALLIAYLPTMYSAFSAR